MAYTAKQKMEMLNTATKDLMKRALMEYPTLPLTVLRRRVKLAAKVAVRSVIREEEMRDHLKKSQQ
jgi:hypothetical protein